MPNINAASITSIRLAEQGSAPATPAAGFAQVYVKSDGLLYWKDDAGVEHAVALTYAGTTDLADVAAAESAGAASTVPRGDHVHAHGSGYLANAHHDQSHGASDHSGDVLPDGSDQTLGAGTLAIAELAAPANPAAGTRKLYVDSTTHKLSVRTSAGTTVSLEEQGSGTLTIQELDGAPSGAFSTLKLPNGTLTDNGDGSATYTPAAGGGGLYSAYLCYQDQKASGTAGGTFTSGAWRTRDLNTEVADTANHGSVASNQLTLDAGTYRVYARAPAASVNRHQARLYDTTATAVLVVGSSVTAFGTSVALSDSVVTGRFTLAVQSVVELQHQCEATKATDGFGVPSGASFAVTHETYTSIELWKE